MYLTVNRQTLCLWNWLQINQVSLAELNLNDRKKRKIIVYVKTELIKCAAIQTKAYFIDLVEVEQKQTIGVLINYCSLLGFM